jgi:hypothetical protein
MPITIQIQARSCPFCGASKILVSERNMAEIGPRDMAWIVQCYDCGCVMYNGSRGCGWYDRSNAITAWNKRLDN